jgi:hypothetical protein
MKDKVIQWLDDLFGIADDNDDEIDIEDDTTN